METTAKTRTLGNVTFSEDDSTLVVRVRRKSMLDLIHLGFGLVLAVAAGVSSPEMIREGSLLDIALVIAVDLAILGIIYTAVAHMYNSTVLRVTDRGVEILDEPLPLLIPDEHPRRVAGVKRLVCDSSPLAILLPNQLVKQRNYRLAAVCWDGKTRILLPLLDTRAEARAVTEAIEQRLNLQRRSV